MQRLSKPLQELKPHYDVVVVGSGYGGGVAASRLARCGRRVAVLERGREIETGAFPARFPDIRRELQVRGPSMTMGSPAGLFDFRQGRDIHVLVGCGLGGGSLINAGVAMRPDARVFADPAWPEELAGDGLLEEGFARATRMLRPAADPNAAALTKYKALASAGKGLDAAPLPAPVAVSFAETVNPAGVHQPACTLCGDCCSGCNVGAKNTVAVTYLADARAHGAEMFTECGVRHLARGEDGRWRIAFRPTVPPRKSEVAPEQTVTADMVVLAAGTLGSTEILLRSRERGLPLSDRLGTHFSANGDIIAFGYGAKVPVNAIGVGHPPRFQGEPVGACVSGQIEIGNGTLDHALYIQEGVMPSSLAPLLPVVFLPGGRLLGAAHSLIKGVYKGPFARLHTFFVVSHDEAKGRIVLKDDRAAIDWPDVGSQEVYRRVDAVLEAAVKANGGTYVKNPLAGTFMGRTPATAHPLGGCGMGADASLGAVDHKCRAFTGADGTDVHEGLYVCDGSIMARSLGVNPLMTISALAERAMMHLARDRGWRFDDAPLLASGQKRRPGERPGQVLGGN